MFLISSVLKLQIQPSKMNFFWLELPNQHIRMKKLRKKSLTQKILLCNEFHSYLYSLQSIKLKSSLETLCFPFLKRLRNRLLTEYIMLNMSRSLFFRIISRQIRLLEVMIMQNYSILNIEGA